MGPGPNGATAAQGRRLELAMEKGWQIRYDGAHDQFVAARDVLAAHTMDDLLLEIERAQGRDDDGD